MGDDDDDATTRRSTTRDRRHRPYFHPSRRRLVTLASTSHHLARARVPIAPTVSPVSPPSPIVDDHAPARARRRRRRGRARPWTPFRRIHSSRRERRRAWWICVSYRTRVGRQSSSAVHRRARIRLLLVPVPPTRSLDRARSSTTTTTRATMRDRYRSNRRDGEKFERVITDAVVSIVARARASTRDPIVRDRSRSIDRDPLARSIDRHRALAARSTRRRADLDGENGEHERDEGRERTAWWPSPP